MQRYELDCPACAYVIKIAAESLKNNPKITCPKCKGATNFDVEQLKARAVSQTK